MHYHEKNKEQTHPRPPVGRPPVPDPALTRSHGDGLDPEMHADERQHEALEILDQEIENAKSFWVFCTGDVLQAADLRARKTDVLIVEHNLELLPADAVGFRPIAVVLSAVRTRM